MNRINPSIEGLIPKYDRNNGPFYLSKGFERWDKFESSFSEWVARREFSGPQAIAELPSHVSKDPMASLAASLLSSHFREHFPFPICQGSGKRPITGTDTDGRTYNVLKEVLTGVKHMLKTPNQRDILTGMLARLKQGKLEPSETYFQRVIAFVQQWERLKRDEFERSGWPLAPWLTLDRPSGQPLSSPVTPKIVSILMSSFQKVAPGFEPFENVQTLDSAVDLANVTRRRGPVTPPTRTPAQTEGERARRERLEELQEDRKAALEARAEPLEDLTARREVLQEAMDELEERDSTIDPLEQKAEDGTMTGEEEKLLEQLLGEQADTNRKLRKLRRSVAVAVEALGEADRLVASLDRLIEAASQPPATGPSLAHQDEFKTPKTPPATTTTTPTSTTSRTAPADATGTPSVARWSPRPMPHGWNPSTARQSVPISQLEEAYAHAEAMFAQPHLLTREQRYWIQRESGEGWVQKDGKRTKVGDIRLMFLSGATLLDVVKRGLRREVSEYVFCHADAYNKVATITRAQKLALEYDALLRERAVRQGLAAPPSKPTPAPAKRSQTSKPQTRSGGGGGSRGGQRSAQRSSDKRSPATAGQSSTKRGNQQRWRPKWKRDARQSRYSNQRAVNAMEPKGVITFAECTSVPELDDTCNVLLAAADAIEEDDRRTKVFRKILSKAKAKLAKLEEKKEDVEVSATDVVDAVTPTSASSKVAASEKVAAARADPDLPALPDCSTVPREDESSSVFRARLASSLDACQGIMQLIDGSRGEASEEWRQRAKPTYSSAEKAVCELSNLLRVIAVSTPSVAEPSTDFDQYDGLGQFVDVGAVETKTEKSHFFDAFTRTVTTQRPQLHIPILDEDEDEEEGSPHSVEDLARAKALDELLGGESGIHVLGTTENAGKPSSTKRGCFYVRMWVNGRKRPHKALVDTGAKVECIREESLTKDELRSLLPTKLSVKNVTSEVSKCSGWFRTTDHFEGTAPQLIWKLVVKYLSHDVVLGVNYLRFAQASIKLHHKGEELEVNQGGRRIKVPTYHVGDDKTQASVLEPVIATSVDVCPSEAKHGGFPASSDSSDESEVKGPGTFPTLEHRAGNFFPKNSANQNSATAAGSEPSWPSRETVATQQLSPTCEGAGSAQSISDSGQILGKMVDPQSEATSLPSAPKASRMSATQKRRARRRRQARAQ